MTPFQEFRLWARRAPTGERASAAVAFLLVLAVLSWVLVPGKDAATSGNDVLLGATPGASESGAAPGAETPVGATGEGGTAVPGAEAGTAGAGGTGTQAAGGSPTAGGAAPGTSGNGAAPGAPAGGTQKAACPAGSATGVSGNRIKIAVVLVNIVGPAANSVFGIATPERQRAFYNAVIEEQNARGGAGCKQIVPQFYEGNPTDQNNLRQICLDVAQAGVFAVLDAGAYSRYPLVDCFARNKIPYFGAYLLDARVQAKNYPYLFNFNTLDRLYRDTVFGLRDRKFFTAENGFQKLGFIYRNCEGALIESFKGWLGEAGISASQLVTYDVGCPTGLVSAADLQQAVLKFQREGVTHMTTASFVGDFATFTKVAQQQGFKPKYGLANDSLIPLTYGSQPPDADNLNGAVAIAASRDGEERTAGMTPTAGTARCTEALKKKGLKSAYEEPPGAGNACSSVWMFAAAVDRAPVLQTNALATGLQAAKSVDFAFPQGPNDFTGNRVTTAGQFWRPAQFTTECKCWRLLDINFQRSYQ